MEPRQRGLANGKSRRIYKKVTTGSSKWPDGTLRNCILWTMTLEMNPLEQSVDQSVLTGLISSYRRLQYRSISRYKQKADGVEVVGVNQSGRF